MKKAILFCKKEAVLLLSAVLAVVSVCLVKPDAAYAGYIDVRTLALLACLMAVVGSAKEQGVFVRLCSALLHRAGSVRAAALVLVLLPFFCSMLITNDVALITFVPLAVGVLGVAAPQDMIFVVVMQTIAANIGSALTPVGNPQNLYLTAHFDISALQLAAVMAPACAAGLALTAGAVLARVKPGSIRLAPAQSAAPLCAWRLAVSGILFVLCVLCVLHLLDWRILLAVVVLVLAIVQPRAFLHIDVSLLLTFVFLFVFVGNMARVTAVRALLSACIDGRVVAVSALASQLLSNVPAALLLSGFTQNGAGLVLGTNLGGLGTPIASMASLISLRIYSRTPGANGKKYMLVFLVFNFAFLALLLALEWLLGAL